MFAIYFWEILKTNILNVTATSPLWYGSGDVAVTMGF
jgi:hypothetical protein